MHAREMLFDQVPDASVEFTESDDHTSVSASQRENLPDTVEENVRYEGVTVRYTLATRLDCPAPMPEQAYPEEERA